MSYRGGGGGQNAAQQGILRFYTDDSPGFQM
ncbi:preprotein translocase subunit Sec61beta [archaeon]|nr:MAG: preprotein translocase subunit Sec61beta [archaeon]